MTHVATRIEGNDGDLSTKSYLAQPSTKRRDIETSVVNEHHEQNRSEHPKVSKHCNLEARIYRSVTSENKIRNTCLQYQYSALALVTKWDYETQQGRYCSPVLPYKGSQRKELHPRDPLWGFKMF